MDYFSYRQFFETQLSGLKLPDDCTLQEPWWVITAPPYFWTVEAFFRFSDQKHIRIWESHAKFAGLQESRKIQWAYHYGPIDSGDEGGELEQGSPDDPVELRIDTAGGLHLHHEKREPHYEQARVVGLDLKTLDAWGFARAVLKHRASGQKFTKILGFKVV